MSGTFRQKIKEKSLVYTIRNKCSMFVLSSFYYRGDMQAFSWPSKLWARHVFIYM